MSKEGEGAGEALSSRGQELRLLVETIPALVSRAGLEGNVEFAAQLQAILNVLPAYTWYAAPSGGLTFVNKRAADYLGVAKDHPLRCGIDIGAQWDDWVPLLHPDDQEEARKHWSNLLRMGEGGEHSYRVRSAQGDYRWFLTRIEPLRVSDGTLLLWVGATLDIEELKCAEQALRESEYKLRQIIETVPSLLWSAGPDGEPTHVSQRLLDYSGMRLEDFQHGGWEAFVHPADFPETAKAFHHAIQTGTSYQAVHRLRRAADGEYRWHHARGEPLRDREGRIVQWYGLSVDIDEAKKAEDRLRRSEAYLAEAQRLSHTGSAAYNEREILYWSEESSRTWGFDPLQGIPSREAVWQRIHPDDLDRVNENIERGVREKRSFANELRIILPDGTVKYIEATNHPAFSASGELLEIVVTGIDVTERKRAEQSLRESETKFRDYAETASDWFWEIGPDYKFTLLTENAFGSHPAGRIGTACWDHALDLETEPEKWRLVRATLDSRKPFRDFVYRGLSGNGTPMYVRASGKPMFDANGEFRGYRGTGTDVTTIMRAQEALRESERSSRSAIDGIAGLVAILAPNGEAETINRQCLEYFGRSLEWLKNWGTSDAVHPEDLPRVVEHFKRAIASGNSYHIDQRLRRFDGEYRWFDTRGVPVRDDSGRIARWYVLLTDIEDRTRALARLEQMQTDFAHINRVSMMGELAASLSHEITQPIASARNNARAAQNFMDMQPPDLSEVREALSCVVGDTDRAGDIVDRIRDHIKKTPPRKGQFDLNEAINEVLLLARSAITDNEISVRTRFAEGPLFAHGDRIQLQQVVLNLVLNAVEAMASVEARTRLLLISTEQNRADEVLVAIRDSGPGIEPDHLERVFEAFYTTKSNGVGMGLSICRSIISAQGGRLWAETKKPRGAVFLFTLPAVQLGA
jgi:PAS domain S-box-containing protein